MGISKDLELRLIKTLNLKIEISFNFLNKRALHTIILNINYAFTSVIKLLCLSIRI